MGVLDGKVAIVTGAGQGLGQAVAEEYGREGATVVVSDINADAAESVAAGIDGATAITCDVTDEGQVKALVEGAVSAHGAVHVMVPNAGIATASPITETSYEDWRAVTSVNLDGVFLCIREAAPAIIGAGGGTIVNICSITALKGLPLAASYAAAKAGVLSLTKTAAVELRDHGVRVHAICPGFIETELVTEKKAVFEEALGLPAGGFDEVIANAQGRFGESSEVARLAVFLASERSSFSSGTEFVLDGGASASLL
jgi:NAD(P)-dependent dehydrogenase (short-subunit alcohol dehydrogenase family)